MEIDQKSLLTTDGFIAAYEQALKEYPTKVSAFEAVNAEHARHFNRPKYSNYDSFRQIRNKRLKKTN